MPKKEMDERACLLIILCMLIDVSDEKQAAILR